jgi:hypothetical protein
VNLTYSGTAANGTDFTGVATVTIPAGSSSANFNIATIDDALTEGAESFTITVASASGGNFENLIVSGTAGSVTTSITDNDTPPVIDLDANNSSGATGANYTTTFTENGAAVSIADTDVSITDVESSNIVSATITLTNFKASDVLAAGVLPGGITASAYNPATGVITLSGSSTLANYQAAIRAITFANTSENPDITPRVINVIVNDGSSSSSNVAVATINVVSVNDAPIGTVDNFTVTEGAVAVLGNVLANDTDVDSPTLNVGQFATNTSGIGAVTANGANSITTALGGTVVMNANGTFTYTAPASRNHSDAISDIDSFVYRASDGSAVSGWTTVSINLTDTAPIANDDVDSLGASTSITGNVITGAGGTIIGGADVLGADAVAITNVTVTQGTLISNTVGAGNVRTIVTTNGTLAIDQDDGNYTYTSNIQTKSLAASGTASVGEWTSAGFTVYGFDTNGTQTNDLYGGNTNSINLTNLNSTSASMLVSLLTLPQSR